jgi:hypothetical protein
VCVYGAGEKTKRRKKWEDEGRYCRLLIVCYKHKPPRVCVSVCVCRVCVCYFYLLHDFQVVFCQGRHRCLKFGHCLLLQMCLAVEELRDVGIGESYIICVCVYVYVCGDQDLM